MKIDIYCHTNRITQKSYVGQSAKGIVYRWEQHKKSIFNTHVDLFAKSIRKHGYDMFNSVLLEQHKTQEDADEAEDFFISYLGTLVPNGYNLMTGGSHGRPCAETRRKQSLAKMGENNPNFGRKFDIATYPNHGLREKRHKSHSIEMIKHSQPNKRSVIVTTTDGDIAFSSLGEATMWLKSMGFPKAAKGNIHKACTGYLKHTYGYTWRWA